MKKHSLLLATNNPGKIKEIKQLLFKLPIKIITIQDTSKIPNDIEIEETGKTFTQNATIKATTLGNMSNTLTLADDSGLVVDALDGRPGVFSHRYGKSTKERNAKLLKELSSIPTTKRTARFIAAVAVYNPKNKKINIFKGVTKGRISSKPLGTQGFGYDPIFFSKDLNKTFAQATLKEKNAVSHRAKALRKAKDFLFTLCAKFQ